MALFPTRDFHPAVVERKTTSKRRKAIPQIKLPKDKNNLDIEFDDGRRFSLPAEYLRVESPSAEVQGHGPGEKTIVAGRAHVGILDLEPVGNYAVRIKFDDLHDTGIFSWDYLYQLGIELGLPGLALVAWLGIAVLGAARRARRGLARDRPLLSLHAGFSSAIVAMALHSLTDFSLHLPANLALFAVVAGGVVGMEREEL